MYKRGAMRFFSVVGLYLCAFYLRKRDLDERTIVRGLAQGQSAPLQHVVAPVQILFWN